MAIQNVIDCIRILKILTISQRQMFMHCHSAFIVSRLNDGAIATRIDERTTLNRDAWDNLPGKWIGQRCTLRFNIIERPVLVSWYALHISSIAILFARLGWSFPWPFAVYYNFTLNFSQRLRSSSIVTKSIRYSISNKSDFKLTFKQAVEM